MTTNDENDDTNSLLVPISISFGSLLVACACFFGLTGVAHAIKSPKAAQQYAPDLPLVPLELVGPDPQVVGYQNQNHGQVFIHQADNQVKLQPVHGLQEQLDLISEPGNGAIKLVGYSGGASCREMVTIVITGSSLPDEEKAMMLDGMKDVQFRDGNVVKYMIQSSADNVKKAKAVYECPEFQKTRDQFMDQFSEESQNGEEKKETSSKGDKTSSKGSKTRQKRTPRLKFYLPSDAESTTGSSSSSSRQRWSDLPESDDD